MRQHYVLDTLAAFTSLGMGTPPPLSHPGHEPEHDSVFVHAVCRPEIQATVKAPAIRNFRMAVTLYYMFAMSLWILVTVIGYW